MVSQNLRASRRGDAGLSQYLDETYVKASGRWCYLHRALDRDGNLPAPVSMSSISRGRNAYVRWTRVT
ncbi:MAG: DDE-type integrase/transposase/recombinase [Chloroflexi bacterium]|nr:DDE-type integrase/transposase/recombinase [Chloroflexota bacterium]